MNRVEWRTDNTNHDGGRAAGRQGGRATRRQGSRCWLRPRTFAIHSVAVHKIEIADMPDPSAKLARLRPVTFQYKTDPQRVRQYGLIAEEVAKVYPELVIRDRAGRIRSVHYEELAPMLLKQLQQQQATTKLQAATIHAQSARVDQLSQQVAGLADTTRDIHAVLQRLQSQDEFVTQR